jgi:hypothetical protein
MATKIKRTELPEIKKMLLKKQKGVCPICKKNMIGAMSKNIVVDHDHSTGRIRAAVHRGCNGLEGKVLKYVTSWGRAASLREIKKVFENLMDFWINTPSTDFIYPTHKTPNEKRLAYNKKRRLAAKKKRGI